ncbi:MAG TPA: hypothetical protein VEL76_36135 [Gemmataceae bacterium]|nr:hypothetical protein [Gemmataceae bacterium]
MSRTAAVLALAVCAGGFLLAGLADGQGTGSRREYYTPGLVVETGTRRGACDVLRFTEDGKHLLAVGDDKVARVWEFTPGRKLVPAETPALRWRTWHENRGNIYAMALSPGDSRKVAIGGQGMSSAGGSVAVIDRLTGKIEHAFIGSVKVRQGTVWSMAFSPSGKQVAYGCQDGSVWVWDVEDGRKAEPRRLGVQKVDEERSAKHLGGKLNYVYFLHYLDARTLVSVGWHGQVCRWNIPPPGAEATPQVMFKFETPALYHGIALSPNGRWLAGVSDAGGFRFVELRSYPDGRQSQKVLLPDREYPHSIAFRPNSTELAVGVRVVAQPEDGATFFKETIDKVYLYDYDPRKQTRTLLEGVTPTYHPEAMTFNPDGYHLAIAGGDDHEVTIWDIDQRREVKGKKEKVRGVHVSQVDGPGKTLWAVGLSPDARYLAFKDQRNRNPRTPNDRGAGDWKFFDLEKRQWAADNGFKPAPQKDREGDWEIRTSLSDAEGKGFALEERRNSYYWFVKNTQQAKIYKLPLDADRDKLPRCYAFLPAVPAKGDKPALPVRLAVGHLWGVSIFDLTNSGPILRRVLSGHEGEVMALAVDGDGRRLVTASRDQTIAGWSLDDWPSQAEVGAHFYVAGGRLYVDTVDSGSPAWEAGLTRGDEIIGLAVAREVLFNRNLRHGNWGKKDCGTPELARDALNNAKPSEEHYFAFRRPGKKEIIEQLTSVRQRPLWRFFPSREGEWVLWRWRDYYYDTSTRGDSLIGWQRNDDNPLAPPEFYKAEQFRNEFHKPQLVAAMLKNWKENPAKIAFLDLQPPEVTVAVSQQKVKEAGITVTLTATPRSKAENHQVNRVLLWINDYQFKEWAGADLGLNKAGKFQRKVFIPQDKLRSGPNLMTLQAYNAGNTRAEATPVQVDNLRAAGDPSLYGIFIGVGNYTQSRGPVAGKPLTSLLAGQDAQKMADLWRRRAPSLYKAANIHIPPPLLDAKATQANILKRLDDLEGKVKPDDRLIFQINGHGTRPVELAKFLKGKAAKQLKGLGQFLFCCADFDVDQLRETTVDFEEIYKRLVRLPCHKILILDACHAGDTRTGLESEIVNPVRVLTKDRVGPMIFAACHPEESAWESNTLDLRAAFGLFSMAVRRTLEERFDDADTNGNGVLDPQELSAQVNLEVKQLLVQLNQMAKRAEGGRLAPGGRQVSAEGADSRITQRPIAILPTFGSGLPLVRRPPEE